MMIAGSLPKEPTESLNRAVDPSSLGAVFSCQLQSNPSSFKECSDFFVLFLGVFPLETAQEKATLLKSNAPRPLCRGSDRYTVPVGGRLNLKQCVDCSDLRPTNS